MRFHDILSDISGSRSKARVLEKLLDLPAKTWTGRQLAFAVQVSQAQANLALKTLKEYGIVSSTRAGAAIVWKVNSSHLLVTSLQPISNMGRRMAPLLSEELGKATDFRKVERIILFGSVARGDERPTSDIDLLVIVKKTSDKETVLKQVLDASAKLIAVFGGNAIVPIIYSKEEAEQRNNSHLMQEIKNEGITIYDGELA